MTGHLFISFWSYCLIFPFFPRINNWWEAVDSHACTEAGSEINAFQKSGRCRFEISLDWALVVRSKLFSKIRKNDSMKTAVFELASWKMNLAWRRSSKIGQKILNDFNHSRRSWHLQIVLVHAMQPWLSLTSFWKKVTSKSQERVS